MALFSGIKCDGCETEKKQSNHWALAEVLNDGIVSKSLRFWEWDDKIAKAPGVLHLCGAGCANKVLSKVFHSWQDAPVEAKNIDEQPKEAKSE